MIIDLGTISPKKVSLFKVGATTTVSNVTLSYAYKEGRLPPGLAIFPDGGIAGTCGERIFEFSRPKIRKTKDNIKDHILISPLFKIG